MHRLQAILAVVFWALAATAETPSGVTESATVDIQHPPPRGYVDRNRDGINDLFRDANGNGVDDVTKKAYPHRFRFEDANGDNINDLFTDADGDGVNDRDAEYVDRDGDGICDNVIDYDGDGVNDITGTKYSRTSLQGGRFGRVDEDRGIIHPRFVDEDGDGMHDRHGVTGRAQRSGMDFFVDEDGDGICDGRNIRGNLEQRAPREGYRERRRRGNGR